MYTSLVKGGNINLVLVGLFLILFDNVLERGVKNREKLNLIKITICTENKLDYINYV